MHHNHIKNYFNNHYLHIIIAYRFHYIININIRRMLLCLKVIILFYDYWLTNGKAQSFSGPDGKGKPFLRIGGFVISDGD